MAVSGHHAKIDSVGDGFVFIDLQSKNGSFVNEQFTNSHWLVDGDIINIGEHSLVFDYANEESMPGNEIEGIGKNHYPGYKSVSQQDAEKQSNQKYY